MVCSHAPIAGSSSSEAASWLPNRAGNARLIGLSRSWNSPVPAGPHRHPQRSSLAPAAPNRDRRFFTCREVITTTVRPAASKASTSVPSPRSMATSVTLFRRSDGG